MDTQVKKVTSAQLLAEIRAIQKEYPDVVYVRRKDKFGKYTSLCSYLPDENNPYGCIVGFAFTRLGVKVDIIWELYGTFMESDFFESVVSDLDLDTKKIIGDIQDNQDEGIPWGLC